MTRDVWQVTGGRRWTFPQNCSSLFQSFFFSLNMLDFLKSRIRETLNLSTCIDRAIICLPLEHLPWLECPAPPPCWPFLEIWGTFWHLWGLFLRFKAHFENIFLSSGQMCPFWPGQMCHFSSKCVKNHRANVSFSGQMCHIWPGQMCSELLIHNQMDYCHPLSSTASNVVPPQPSPFNWDLVCPVTYSFLSYRNEHRSRDKKLATAILPL